MSSDLLAELDSFYRSPQNGVSNAVNTSTVPSASALDGLSFFGASNTSNPVLSQALSRQGQQQKQQQRSSIPASPLSNDDIWRGHGGLHAVGPSQSVAPSDMDLWGSFESMAETARPNLQSPPNRSSGPFLGGAKDGVTPTSTKNFFSSKMASNEGSVETHLRSFFMPSQPPRKSPAQPSVNKYAPRVESDILFDATSWNDSNDHSVEDDEFGDFETAMSSPPNQHFLPIVSPLIAPETSGKLSFTSNLATMSPPYPKAPKPLSSHKKNPPIDLELSTKTTTSMMEHSPNMESSVFGRPVDTLQSRKNAAHQGSTSKDSHDDEGWGDFADLPAPTIKPKPSPVIEADAWVWDAIDNPIAQAAVQNPVPAPALPLASSAVPPTNIPPPSILLSLFPQIFNLPQSTLFQSVANQSFTVRNRILSDPSTITFLQGYIHLATVAARIIAGRKLRWKRDLHLSQAMRIGPAAAAGGKGGGMKLTVVDRAEATREDREASEVVRVWREQVGRLRSAIAVANSNARGKAARLTVPEIGEAMQVKSEPGAPTALKPCSLCGLKRDERIVKIDVQIEDSFGEWWVEHWGHRTCRNFWVEQEGELRHR